LSPQREEEGPFHSAVAASITKPCYWGKTFGIVFHFATAKTRRGRKREKKQGVERRGRDLNRKTHRNRQGADIMKAGKRRREKIISEKHTESA